MSIYISVNYSDFSSEAREEKIEQIKAAMLDAARAEGEELLKKDWHEPAPKTWQEAYVRSYAISYIMWDEYERGDAEAEVPSAQDWEDWLTEDLDEKAENHLYDALKHLEVEAEVEI